MPRNWGKGTPSGKLIGEEAWSYRGREGERFKGGVSMLLRTGRAVVQVSLSIPPGQGQGWPLAAPEDVQLVETQAELCIQRLQELGL
jgi:hypothetical protein